MLVVGIVFCASGGSLQPCETCVCFMYSCVSYCFYRTLMKGPTLCMLLLLSARLLLKMQTSMVCVALCMVTRLLMLKTVMASSQVHNICVYHVSHVRGCTGASHVLQTDECEQFFKTYSNEHAGNFNTLISSDKIGCPFRTTKQEFDEDTTQGYTLYNPPLTALILTPEQQAGGIQPNSLNCCLMDGNAPTGDGRYGKDLGVCALHMFCTCGLTGCRAGYSLCYFIIY